MVAHRTTDAIDQKARDKRVEKSEALLGKIGGGEGIKVKVTPTCKPSDNGRVIYNTLGQRTVTPLLQTKSYVQLHFSRSSNGGSMAAAIPYQNKYLSVEPGQSLSKWLIGWSERLGIYEGHLIITQIAPNRYHAYFHAMGSHGYC